MRAINSSLQIVKYNLKLFKATIIIALIYTACALLLFSFKLAEAQYMAKFSEYYLSIVGLLLFPQLSIFDKEVNMQEMVYPKEIPHKTVFLIRVTMMLIINLLIYGVILSFAKYEGADFQLAAFMFGAAISSLCLGIIGLLTTSIFENKISGYLIGFCFYILNYQGGERVLGKFYLFTLTINNFPPKAIFLAAALILIFIIYFIIDRKN